MARGINRSRAGIRVCASRNRPFAPGRKWLVALGSAALPGHTSFLEVHMPSVAQYLPAVYTDNVYFRRNRVSAQKSIPPQFCHPSSPSHIKNVLNTCKRTRRHEYRLPVRRVSSLSPEITLPPLTRNISNPGTPVRFHTSSAAPICPLGSPLPSDAHLTARIAAVLEKLRFSWLGTFCCIFVFCSVLLPHSLAHITSLHSLTHTLLFCFSFLTRNPVEASYFIFVV